MFGPPDRGFAPCQKSDIHEIALGYPLNMDGSAGESAKRSERFKAELLEMDPTLSVSSSMSASRR
jgi:RNase H-fold protein (predicted Holliday junction resolvase)